MGHPVSTYLQNIYRLSTHLEDVEADGSLEAECEEDDRPDGRVTRSCCPCRDSRPPGGVPDGGVEAAAVEADQVVLGQLYVAQRGRGLRPPAQGH